MLNCSPALLQVTSFNNTSFSAELEDALNYGQPILIDHVSEDVDPAINDVIAQKFNKRGRIQSVSLTFFLLSFYPN